MKNILVLVLAFCFSFNTVLFAQSGENITPYIRTAVENIAENTFRYLKRNQPNNIRQYLYPGITIALLDSDELRELMIDFTSESISEFDYKLKTSGNNMAFFSEKNGKIISDYKVLKEIYVGNTIDNDNKRLNYHFLRINVFYHNIVTNSSGETSHIPAEMQVEIQIAQVRNEFKIIGFIL